MLETGRNPPVLEATFRMCKSTALLSLAAILIAVTPTAGGAASDATATVTFALKPCPLAISHPFTGGDVTYQIWDGKNNVEKKLLWNSRDPKPLHLALSLKPGVYTYDVNGRYVHGSELVVGCQAYWYFAVLPGEMRQINDEMGNCCGDPIPPLYIAGIVPAGYHVSVARFDDAPSCGAPLSNFSPTEIDVERTAIGYYAKDDHLSGSARGRGAVFGVKVSNPSSQSRTLRVVADYPKQFVGGLPTLVRLDLTDTLLMAAFAEPAGNLFCGVSGPPAQPQI